MTTTGMISVYAITSVGLFCSTLWPCIFALSVRGLGKHTSQGSSFLIMMIMGGGIISWLQGSFLRVLGFKTVILLVFYVSHIWHFLLVCQ